MVTAPGQGRGRSGAQGAGKKPELSTVSGGNSMGRTEGITYKIDPGVLDCPVCFGIMAPPIFQCYNGHIACSSCCTRLKSCPSCSGLIGLRCLAMEKVIQSVTVSCPYTSLGCQEMVSYADRYAHAETCIYSQCHCPIDECTFEGPAQDLYGHFTSRHLDCSTNFKCDVPFEVYLHKDDRFHVLRWAGGGGEGVLFLLLNNNEAPMGNVVTIACLGPSSMKGRFWYRLTANSGESSTKFKSTMMNIKRWEGYFPQNDFLLIPQGFFCEQDGNLKLQIFVQNKGQRAQEEPELEETKKKSNAAAGLPSRYQVSV